MWASAPWILLAVGTPEEGGWSRDRKRQLWGTKESKGWPKRETGGMEGTGSFSACYSEAGAETKSTNETGVYSLCPGMPDPDIRLGPEWDNVHCAAVRKIAAPTPRVFLQLSE